MKSTKKLLAALLCVGIILGAAGCSAPPAATMPPTARPPATEPPVVVDVPPLLNQVRTNLQKADSYSLQTRLAEERLVGGETFTESVTGSTTYSGLNSDTPQALVEQQLVFGTFESDYREFYRDGTAYSAAEGSTFRQAMSFSDFHRRQPPLLPDSSLYSSISATTDGNTTVITFAQPQAMEAWVTDVPGAVLTDATATVTVGSTGDLISSDFEIRYSCGPAAYILTVRHSLTMGIPAGFEPPEIPENCVTLEDLDVPRLILQAVGDIYSAESITASYNNSLYSQAYSTVRTQSNTFEITGTGNGLYAKITQNVSATDYTNTPKTSREESTYIDGVFTATLNGGEPQVLEGITAQDVRVYCEDELLAPLMTLDLIAGASTQTDGDFLYITLNGNDAFSQKLCAWIYGLFQSNLDLWATSHTTEKSQAYLCINRHTGLPTSIGVDFLRTHISGNVPYTLSYQHDESLLLASPSAYESITGEPRSDSADPVTPLFYKVTSPEGQTLWLLGTIHAGDRRMANLPEYILDALNAADALAVECDIDRFSQQISADPELMGQLAQCYCYTDGSTLRNHLEPDLYQQLCRMILASGRRFTSSDLYRAVIWWDLISDFGMQQGYSLSSFYGAEQILLELARSNNKPILEIESGLGQIQMLAGFSDALQAALLESALDTGLTAQNAASATLYELWCAGDANALADALHAPAISDPALNAEYEKAMITDRNALMLAAVQDYLKSGQRVFCAVGLAHVLGETGLVQQLQNAGYTVEPVY